jgi:hypothetical protein
MILINPAMRPCDVESFADFGRYYRYAWLAWHAHPQGPQPVNVQQIGAHTMVVSDVLGQAHAIHWRQAMDTLSFGTPDLGMVNGDHTIIYLHQTSPRQPHRGYRPNAVTQSVFNAWALRKTGKIPTGQDREVLKNLFFPRFYELKEAIEQLNSGARVGCALSPKVALYTNSADKYPSIAYRRNTIGFLESDRKAVIPRVYADAIPVIQKTLGTEVQILS